MTKTLREVDVDALVEMLCQRPYIPDGEAGDVRVSSKVIPKNTSITVVSMRNAIMMGWRPTVINFTHDLTVRELSYEGGTWMKDDPQELWQMYDPLQSVFGSVLVGGLGLGVFSHLASQQYPVDDIVTIEHDSDVIELVAPHIDSEVIQGDLFDIARKIKPGEYDSAFLDIWQSTGETSWKHYVTPLRRMLRSKIDVVMCWNEEEMIGQLQFVLPRVALMGPDIDIGRMHSHYAVFRDACQRTGLTTPMQDPDMTKTMEASVKLSQNKDFRQYMSLFLDPSSDRWESEFGDLWDMHFANKADARASSIQ